MLSPHAAMKAISGGAKFLLSKSGKVVTLDFGPIGGCAVEGRGPAAEGKILGPLTLITRHSFRLLINLHSLDVGGHGHDTRHRACIRNEFLNIRPARATGCTHTLWPHRVF